MQKVDPVMTFEEMIALRVVSRDGPHKFPRVIPDEKTMAAAIVFGDAAKKGLLIRSDSDPKFISYKMSEKGKVELGKYENSRKCHLVAMLSDAVKILHDNAGNDFEPEVELLDKFREITGASKDCDVGMMLYSIEKYVW